MSESCENNAFCNKWHPILKAAILDRISVGSNSAGRSHPSVAEIAKAVNASRPTVYKHIDYVSNLLKEFGATHKHRSPDAKIKKLQSTIQELENEIISVKARNAALQDGLADIFQTLNMHQSPLREVILGQFKKKSAETGPCDLCGQ